LERQVGRRGGLPRRTHASRGRKVEEGEEIGEGGGGSKRRGEIRRLSARRARYTYITAPTPDRARRARTYIIHVLCVSTYALAFLPRLLFNAFMPTAEELSGISRRKSGTLCLRQLTFLLYHPILTYDSPACPWLLSRLVALLETSYVVVLVVPLLPSSFLTSSLPIFLRSRRSCCCCCCCCCCRHRRRCRRWRLQRHSQCTSTYLQHHIRHSSAAKFSPVHKLFSLSLSLSQFRREAAITALVRDMPENFCD